MIAEGLALIFDMDGVLVDSNPLHREAWAAFNLRYGLETTEEMHQRMYGRRNDAILRDFFGNSLTPEELVARSAAKEALYREMMASRLEEYLVPGVREFLVASMNARKGLASNAEPENIDFVLDRAGLRPYFQIVMDGRQVQRAKPDPEIYLRTSELLNTPPEDCIVFEDSHTGVAAARSAGMRVVGVSTTEVDLPGSTITIDNFLSGDLSQWLLAQQRAQ